MANGKYRQIKILVFFNHPVHGLLYVVQYNGLDNDNLISKGQPRQTFVRLTFVCALDLLCCCYQVAPTPTVFVIPDQQYTFSRDFN